MLAFGSTTDQEDPPTGDALAAVQAAVQIIPLAAVAHTAAAEVVAVNDQCAALLQVPAEQMRGRRMRDFIPVGDLVPVGADTVEHRPGVEPQDAAPTSSLSRLMLADGSAVTCWMHIGVATIAGHQLFIACMDLVNPVLTDADRWRQRADYDELTGLLRRGPLLEKLKEWLAGGDQVVFGFLDVDSLKLINDTHGHAAGDHVLSVMARRLEQYVPPGCLVSRLSGDEFVLARPIRGGGGSTATLSALTAAAARCEADPVAWDEHLLSVSVSTGVVVSRPGEKSGPLMARADAAMYAEKTQRRVRSIPPRHRLG
jgi:diguanylate cyclase (GGDEF)-like protein